MILADKNLCIGCCNCLIICPVGAIELKGNKAYIDNDSCVSCKVCIGDCPQNALSFDKKKVFGKWCIISTE